MTTLAEMPAWRVQIINADGITSGPFMTSTCQPWTPTLAADCPDHDRPSPDCACGIYATGTFNALAVVVQCAQEMVSAAEEYRVPGNWPATVVNAGGVLALCNPRTAVIVLRGTLLEAVPRDTAPPRLLPVRRRQLQTLSQRTRNAIIADPSLNDVLFHALADHTDPPGTWAGARFITEAVYPVRRARWVADLLAPLPVHAYSELLKPDQRALQQGPRSGQRSQPRRPKKRAQRKATR